MLHNLSRREFLMFSGLLALDRDKRKQISAEIQKQDSVSFEEALADVSLRQKYIDELVTENSSPYVEEVIYDNDKSKAFELAVKMSIAEASLDYHIMHHDNKNIKPYDKVIILHGLMRRMDNMPEVVNEAKKNASPEDFGLNEAAMGTLNFSDGYGLGFKSKMYVFNDSFTEWEIETPEFPIKIQPSEEIFKMHLSHEYKHAANGYKGLTINDNLVVSHSDYQNISDEIAHFVEEGSAYLSGIEFSRQFGKNNSAYLLAVDMFDVFMTNEIAKLDMLKINTYEKELMAHYKLEFNKLTDEIKMVRIMLGQGI